MGYLHRFKVADEYIEKKLNNASAIKNHCLDCSGGSKQDRKDCNIIDCALFPFRFGTNPGRKKVDYTDEQIE